MSTKCTLLHFAAASGSVKIVNILLDQEINVDARDCSEHTPLHWATQNVHTEIVNALLEAKANVDARDCSGHTPLHFAAKNGYTDAINALLEAKANVDARDCSGHTPLHWAAQNGHTEIVNALLEAKANVDARDCSGHTPLHWAAENGHTDAINALLEAKAEVDARDGEKFTPLHFAAENGHTDAINALLEAKAEVDARDDGEHTPLHWAVHNQHTDAVNALLEAKANVDARGYNGQTPLYRAVISSDIYIINALLEAKAEVDARDDDGQTPLHWATRDYFCTYVDVIDALLDRGADINATDRQGMTPLHLTVESGCKDATEALIQRTLIQDFSAQKPDYLTGAFSTYWDRCLDEVKKLERENKLLYDFLKESDTSTLVSIWEKNEDVRNNFDNQESLKEQYPEYAHTLINKANEVKKEIFLHNHRPLIDFLSTHYESNFQAMSFADIRNFFEVHKNDLKEERIGVRNNTLIYFADFENVKERGIPTLKVKTFVETVKNKDINSNLKCPNSLDNEIKSSIQDNRSVQHIIAQKDSVDTSGSTSQSEQEKLSQFKTQNQDPSEIASTVKHMSTSGSEHSEASSELEGNSGQQNLQPETSVRAFVATDQKNGTHTKSHCWSFK